MSRAVALWYTCPACGKRSYDYRRQAKSVAKKISRGGRLYVYRCGSGWHIGHVPIRVKTGDTSRHDFTPKQAHP